MAREDAAEPIIRPVVEAAHAEPALRQLFPFTSHWSLHFTRCTGVPYSRDIPFIAPLGGGRYRVGDPTHGNTLGETDDPRHAISFVLDHLPASCGPAVAGTADDLTAS
jgi:hypothetical protein